jgi:polysaccharide biosynthesis protein PelE
VPETRRFSHALQVAAVASATLAAECMIVHGLFRPAIPWWLPPAGHLAVILALGVWWRYSPGLREDARLPLLLVGGTGALGPLGAAGTLIAMALSRWYMRKSRPFEEWYEALFPNTLEDTSQEFATRVAMSNLDNPNDLAPFSEVLAFGSIQQKQALITLINQSFRPAFGPILKRALTDENNSIRVQAATAMNKLENAMLGRTLELSHQAQEEPRKSIALLALARHYDDYIYGGLLDPRREEEIRELAVDAYRQFSAAEPGNQDSSIAISRLLVRGRRYAEALVWLEKAMRAGGATSQAEFWYMESLYHLGRFTELGEFARSRPQLWGEGNGFPDAAREAVQMWGLDGRMAPAESALSR